MIAGALGRFIPVRRNVAASPEADLDSPAA